MIQCTPQLLLSFPCSVQKGLANAVHHNLTLLSQCPAILGHIPQREAVAVVAGLGGLRLGPAFEGRVSALLNGLLLLEDRRK